MRVVLDATVLVRAHPRSSSAGRKVLAAVLDGWHTLLLSSAIIAETAWVLRFPRLQKIHALTDDQLYDYAHHAPLRDANDLDVMQTAERGDADILCSNDGDFHEAGILGYCAARGIEVCDEKSLLALLMGS